MVRDRWSYDKSGELATSIFLSVEYSFNMGVLLDELKPVLVMADNYCLFKGRKGKNIDFLIEYHTHKYVNKNKEDRF